MKTFKKLIIMILIVILTICICTGCSEEDGSTYPEKDENGYTIIEQTMEQTIKYKDLTPEQVATRLAEVGSVSSRDAYAIYEDVLKNSEEKDIVNRDYIIENTITTAVGHRFSIELGVLCRINVGQEASFSEVLCGYSVAVKGDHAWTELYNYTTMTDPFTLSLRARGRLEVSTSNGAQPALLAKGFSLAYSKGLSHYYSLITTFEGDYTLTQPN